METLHEMRVLGGKKSQVLFNPSSLDFYSLDAEHGKTLRRFYGNKRLSPSDRARLDAIRGSLGADVKKEASGPRLEHSPMGKADASQLSKSLHRLTLILTNKCNMRCSYCYEAAKGSENLGFGSHCAITLDTAQKALDDYFSSYERIQTIMFFGGEPLLEFDLLKDIVAYVREKKEGGEIDYLPNFGIITNATLLNGEMSEYFASQGFQVTVSLDGPQRDHDAYRVFPNGKGSFSAVVRGLRLLKEHKVPVMAQASITPKAVSLGDDAFEISKHFMESYGLFNPHIVPVQFTPGSREKWGLWLSARIKRQYCSAVKKTLMNIEKGDLANVYSFSYIQAVLGALIKKTSSSIRCPAGFEAAVAPDGAYYPCFMLVDEAKKFAFGGVDTGITEAYWQRLGAFLGSNLKSEHKECSLCWARGICIGCLGGVYKATGALDGNDALMCGLMKDLAKTIILYLAEISDDQLRWARFVENFRTLSKKPNAEKSPC